MANFLKVVVFSLVTIGFFAAYSNYGIPVITPAPPPVEEKIDHIRDRINTSSEVLFTELFTGSSDRLEIIVTFLAILEMVKLGELSARQMTAGGDVWLYKPGGAPEEGHKEISDGVREQG